MNLIKKGTWYFSILFLLSCFIISCSREKAFGGRFRYFSGECSSKLITLKKVKGFGDKYYLINIYKTGNRPGRGREFLGVVNGSKLTIYRGTRLRHDNLDVAGRIMINGDRISVTTDNKSCIYMRSK